MEIGSEYNIDLLKLNYCEDNIFEYLKLFHTKYLDSGRSGLRMLSEKLPFDGTVLLPEYVCKSVRDSFHQEIKFYPLDDNLVPIEQQLEECVDSQTVCLVVSPYFGCTFSEELRNKILAIKKKYDLLVIEDTTHSIFSSRMTVGDYCVCSLRKWFAIPDGGVIYSLNDSLNVMDMEIVKTASVEKAYGMILKTLYLNGVLDKEIKPHYLQIMKEAENAFDYKEKSYAMSNLSNYLLKCYNVSELVKRRQQNYKNLIEFFNEFETIRLVGKRKTQQECPFCVPVICESRDELRRFLIEKNIFCAVHWPIVSEDMTRNKHAMYISNNILSLPIDQRYSYDDMNYIKNAIVEFERNL